jgi:hypothetical protein
MLADRRDDYNHQRLHSSPGYTPSAEFNKAWQLPHQNRLSLVVAH